MQQNRRGLRNFDVQKGKKLNNTFFNTKPFPHSRQILRCFETDSNLFEMNLGKYLVKYFDGKIYIIYTIYKINIARKKVKIS